MALAAAAGSGVLESVLTLRDPVFGQDPCVQRSLPWCDIGEANRTALPTTMLGVQNATPVDANMLQAPGWFWQEADGTWLPYRPGDSDELDRMKATGRPNAIVAGVYKVDFRTMTQTNTRTRFPRPVRCSDGNAQAGAVEAAAVVVAVH